MTANEYLREILKKNSVNGQYTQNETTAYNNLSTIVKDWFNQTYRSVSPYGYYNTPSVDVEIQRSGSRAKGTAIKGSSDLDLFVSITDKENVDKLENYFNDLYDFLDSKNLQVRKQNVSIGVTYYGCAIDVVPAKKCNSQSYVRGWDRFNDHYLWSTKKQGRTLTNIQKHIDIVSGANIQNEIMLVKIWRKRHKIDFPSIYIELLAIDALNGKRTYDLSQDFWAILTYIRDVIENKKIVDPSNSNNTISDTLTSTEKTKIKNQANSSLSAKRWEDIIW